ncbi:hypothetical protein D3C80_1590610 [compost metagenome]
MRGLHIALVVGDGAGQIVDICAELRDALGQLGVFGAGIGQWAMLGGVALQQQLGAIHFREDGPGCGEAAVGRPHAGGALGQRLPVDQVARHVVDQALLAAGCCSFGGGELVLPVLEVGIVVVQLVLAPLQQVGRLPQFSDALLALLGCRHCRLVAADGLLGF